MNHINLGQLFDWPNLRYLCGKPAASWSINDQMHAEAQDLERKRVAAEGQDSEAVTSAVAKEQERHARHVEQILATRDEQSARIMDERPENLQTPELNQQCNPVHASLWRPMERRCIDVRAHGPRS